jgi:hypothetical protein
MANLNGFNANEVDPSMGFDPVPAGKYLAIISGSQMKPTKSGVGNYLELTFQILDGEFKGRLLWARLNLDNPKAEMVKFARAELSAICRALGVMAPKDSVELHNLPVVITVAHKKRNDTGEITNVIKGYAKKEMNGTRTAAPAGSNGKAPWQK